jgi:hypothetical protein
MNGVGSWEAKMYYSETPRTDIGTLFFTALMLGGAYYAYDFLHNANAAVGLLLLGGAIAVVGKANSQSRPKVMVDDLGISDERLGVGKILWEHVEEVHIEVASGVRYLCLGVRQDFHYISKLDQERKKQMQYSRELGFRRFSIDMRGVDVSLLDIKDLVARKHRRKRSF